MLKTGKETLSRFPRRTNTPGFVPPETHLWREETAAGPMAPSPRSGHAAQVAGDRCVRFAVVYSGISRVFPLPGKMTWNTNWNESKMNFPRRTARFRSTHHPIGRFPTFAFVGPRMYVMGGSDGSTEFSDLVEYSFGMRRRFPPCGECVGSGHGGSPRGQSSNLKYIFRRQVTVCTVLWFTLCPSPATRFWAPIVVAGSIPNRGTQ